MESEPIGEHDDDPEMQSDDDELQPTYPVLKVLTLKHLTKLSMQKVFFTEVYGDPFDRAVNAPRARGRHADLNVLAFLRSLSKSTVQTLDMRR